MKPKISFDRRGWRVALAVVLVGGAVFVSGGVSASASDPPPADCGYAGCHNGAPVPGTEATPTPPPVRVLATLSRPTVPARPRAKRALVIGGSLLPAHAETTTVEVTLARKVGRRYRTWRTFAVSLPPSLTRYTVKVRLPRKGAWRARTSHTDALHVLTLSRSRFFSVK